MAKYLKLGASKNTDRDTSLFQALADLREEDEDGGGGGDKQSWPPAAAALRRAQSTRERAAADDVVAPRRSVSSFARNLSEQQHQQDDLIQQKLDDQAKASRKFEVGFLRRAKSSREPFEQQQQQSQQIHHINDKRFTFTRTQSMRYNRIVSADEDPSDGGLEDPPRHSSSVERMIIDDLTKQQQQQQQTATRKKKNLVRISASHQTKDGEILSIECSRCGRWLGTVAKRVNLDEGSLKLCQICHPVTPAAALNADESQGLKAASVCGKNSSLKKGGLGFLRGLRKMLGLKKTATTTTTTTTTR